MRLSVCFFIFLLLLTEFCTVATHGSSEHWHKAVQAFMFALTECVIRFVEVGNQNQEYFDYFISKRWSPIIVENLHLDKYKEPFISINHTVSWRYNIFINRKFGICSSTFFNWKDEPGFFLVLNGMLAGGREIPEYFVLTSYEGYEPHLRSDLAQVTAKLRMYPVPTKFVVLSYTRNHNVALSCLCLHCSTDSDVLAPLQENNLRITRSYFEKAWKTLHNNFAGKPLYVSTIVASAVWYQKETTFCSNYKKEIEINKAFQPLLQPTTCILVNLMDLQNCSISFHHVIGYDIQPNIIVDSVSYINIRSGLMQYLSNPEFHPIHQTVTLIFSKREIRLATMTALLNCMDSSTWICTLISILLLWVCLTYLSDGRIKDPIKLLLLIYGTVVSNSNFKRFNNVKLSIILCIWLISCVIISNGFAGIIFSLMTKLVSENLPKSFAEVFERNYHTLTTNVYQRSEDGTIHCRFQGLLNYLQEPEKLTRPQNAELYKKLNKTVKCLTALELMKSISTNTTSFGTYFTIIDPKERAEHLSQLMEGFVNKIIAVIDQMPDQFSTLLAINVRQNFILEIISRPIASFYESGISNLWKQRESLFVFLNIRKSKNSPNVFRNETTMNSFIRRKILNLPSINEPEALPLTLDLLQRYFLWYSILLAISALIFCIEHTWNYFFTW